MSTDQVASVFQRLTGERLTISRNPYFDALNLPPSALTRAYGRYGQFSIYVMRQGSVAVTLTEHRTGPTPRPTADGIYWKQQSSGPATWEADKAFGNVVLLWQAGRQRITDERWARLVRILQAATAPAGTPAANLPPEDVACEHSGIVPASTKDGTCRLRDQTLVVGGARAPLVLGGLTASSLTLQTGSSIHIIGGPTMHSRGAFVVVRFNVLNRSPQPILLLDTQLVVGARRFSPDAGKEIFFDAGATGPLAAGRSGPMVRVFDIPSEAAQRLRSEGVFALPGDRNTFLTLPYATTVGWIRLRDAPTYRPPPGRRSHGTAVPGLAA
ncbi:MAG: hypothetical protein M3Z27_10165 [Actinomycetota bacterium]|nr:hypothetical protein [Actinomycetota bacterium]